MFWFLWIKKMDYTRLEQRAEELLEHRGISGHRAANRFVEDFKAYLIRYHAVGIGSAEQTMRLLESDEHLTDSSILYTNFRSTLDDLVSDALIQDPIFSRMFNILLDNNGKGVGAGELALPLVLSNYRFSIKFVWLEPSRRRRVYRVCPVRSSTYLARDFR